MEANYRSLEQELEAVKNRKVLWRKITAENLDVDYGLLLPRLLGSRLLDRLESELEYFTGDLAKIFVYGKWHPIHRQQVAFGDTGLTYTFSGNTIPALKWTPVLLCVRDIITAVTGHYFNFVLINRYRDGSDHISEHRDDERDLDPAAPIASLSLGRARDFIFKHCDARKPEPYKRNVSTVKLVLEHGYLLMMNPPTNKMWYHSLPPRKNCHGVRVNLTFRKMVQPS
ncbi:hypothetical protein L9F63_011402 [Diploptera punctata]|uniref:DNA oxidative demethylase ALKBH2 n=1 Tax=Diploptera punctata TaxID=6984 RepID=A0AAD8EQ05_DIPPU|nr:hypothetical protein L9F63_011402 [Diploptera punctata]